MVAELQLLASYITSSQLPYKGSKKKIDQMNTSINEMTYSNYCKEKKFLKIHNITFNVFKKSAWQRK